jgi:hypothetical protein
VRWILPGRHPQEVEIGQDRLRLRTAKGEQAELGGRSASGSGLNRPPRSVIVMTPNAMSKKVPFLERQLGLSCLVAFQPSRCRIAVKPAVSNNEATDTCGGPGRAASPRCNAASSTCRANFGPRKSGWPTSVPAEVGHASARRERRGLPPSEHRNRPESRKTDSFQTFYRQSCRFAAEVGVTDAGKRGSRGFERVPFDTYRNTWAGETAIRSGRDGR